MGQRHFKKPFEFHNFSEMFYCRMTRLRSMNLSMIIQCQYTRTTLRNKNMGQILFRKHSKFQNFDEIYYCGMTKLKNTNLDLLYDVSTQDLFQERKIWYRFCLRIIQNF